MRRALKFIVYLVLVCTVFIGVVVAAFYYLVRAGEVRRYLVGEIERQTQLKVELGDADLEIGRILAVRFRDVAISPADGGEAAIKAADVTLRVAFWPLLERKLIFYEIRLGQPTARIVRVKDGAIPLLEKLVNLPFLKNHDAQFAVDLRTIKIAGGEVEFDDYLNSDSAVTTRLSGLDLALDRLGATALQQFFQKLRRKASEQSQAAALRFDLRTILQRDGKQAAVWAKGTMVFPDDRIELQNLWWNAETWLSDVPAPLLQAYGARRAALKSLDGTLNAQLHVEGNLRERFQLRGQVMFRALAVDAPTLFSAPLAPGDGRLDLDLNWRPGRWELSRADFRSQEVSLDLKTIVARTKQGDAQIQLSLTAPFLPLSVIKKYLAAEWLHAPGMEAWFAALQQGEIRVIHAALSSPASEIGAIGKSALDERLSFEAELRDVATTAFSGYLPLRAGQGRVSLEKGVVSFRGLAASYGQSRLSNVSGTYRLAPGAEPALRLHAAGEVELAELREQLKQGWLAAQGAKVAGWIQDMAGRGRFDLAVTRSAGAAPQLDGTIALDGARLQVDNFSLADIHGELALSPTAIKGEKIRALLSGSPVRIQLALEDYAGEGGTFDFLVDSAGMRAGVITRLLLSTGSLQDPGMARGFMRYQGPFAGRTGRKLTGTLDIAGVQLAVGPLLQPLRELGGRINIDENGIDFQNLKGLLVGFAAAFNGRWRYAEKPQLAFDFTAPNLDITYLMSQIDTEASDFYSNLEAQGRIALGQGLLRGLEFSEFKSDVVLDHRVWRLTNAVVRLAGGSVQGVGTFMDQPQALAYDVTPKVEQVPVATFVKWFDIANTDMTGRVNLTGQFKTVGKDTVERKRNLNGAFALAIEDGTIHRMRILVQLLNLLDLSRWFTLKLPDLTKQGIRFRKITGDFKVADGVYTTENLVVDSDDLRMTGGGKINVPRDEVDFVVAVRPFAGIDTAINYIPLIGRGIAAIKNSFLVASFNITGPIDRPTITPAPLSTLSEMFLSVLGVPKNMLGLGGDAKSKSDDTLNQEQPQESPPESTPAPQP